jgi:hypothetical protein
MKARPLFGWVVLVLAALLLPSVVMGTASLIRLQSGSFNPLSQYSIEAFRPSEIEQRQWLVSVEESAIELTRQAVEQFLGKPVAFYIPDNAYLVDASAQQAARIRKIAGVLWVGPMTANQRLAPAFSKAATLASESACTGDQLIEVLFVPRAVSSLDQARNIIRQAGVSDSDIVDLFLATARVRTSCSKFSATANALSALPLVHWVEPSEPYQVDNKYSHGTTQSGGNFDNQPIWSKGIFGADEIVGCAHVLFVFACACY